MMPRGLPRGASLSRIGQSIIGYEGFNLIKTDGIPKWKKQNWHILKTS
jgi:hypothetical protein